MTSSRVVYREIYTAPTAFDADAYANVLLHPVLRSLMLEDEEDYRSYKASFYNQMRGASKGGYKRPGVTTSGQIQLNGVKSRGTIEDTTDCHSRKQGRLVSGQSRQYHQERIKCPTCTNKPSFERASRRSLNIDRNGQEIQEVSKQSCNAMHLRNEQEYRSLDQEPRDSICEHAVTKYRERLNYYEARRLQRQSEQLGIEYRPLLALNTDYSYLEYRKNNDFDDGSAKNLQDAKSKEEVEELCERVREHVSRIRDRVRSSRGLLAKRDSDRPVAGKNFHEPSSTGQGWAEFDAKFYRDTNQDQGSLPVLAREAFEIGNDSIAFGPFLPKPEKSISWNDAPGYVSNPSPKTQDVLKPLKVSEGTPCRRAGPNISSSTKAASMDKKLQIEKDTSGSNLKPKVIKKLTVMQRISRGQKVLICASNRKNFHEGHSGQWSQGTADSSSCATPSTANCDDSRNRSNKSKDGSKNEKSRKSNLPFMREKVVNIEWLCTSIDREILRSESEMEMHEWLNNRVIPGWDIARQESVRCGPMEMVFYDHKTPHHFNAV